uniref:Uncharacterized protein n=1 Tax=Aegilops tauschii subsp. strangulata TaxID=200361 RepID=A0A453PTS7_AEGTS
MLVEQVFGVFFGLLRRRNAEMALLLYALPLLCVVAAIVAGTDVDNIWSSM